MSPRLSGAGAPVFSGRRAVLLVAHELAVANAVQKLFDEIAGPRLWLCHERSARAAADVLSGLQFSLIALDLALPNELPGLALRLIKRGPHRRRLFFSRRPRTWASISGRPSAAMRASRAQ